jgi:tRNA A37 N6-isopentenylltransferase MiaA
MECYYQGMQSRSGYRKQILQILAETMMFRVTVQRLADRTNQVRKKQLQWLSERKRRFEFIEDGEYVRELGESKKDQEKGGASKKR